jgi:membrane protease YdiL (CAAX protease family)
VICWLVLNAILTLVNASVYAAQARQVGCTTIFFGIVIAGIASHWHWPAYVFIFWLLLSVMGFVMSRALTAIVRQFRD